MSFTRFVLTAAAAAGAAYYFREPLTRYLANAPGAPRFRLALGGGMGGAAPASAPVGETMWTPDAPSSRADAPSAGARTPAIAPAV